jgi:hypothetical protein
VHYDQIRRWIVFYPSDEDEFEAFETRPETHASEQAFKLVEASIMAAALHSDPKVRARVRQAGSRGYLPIALGLLVGGLVGDHFGGPLGWLIGMMIGLYIGVRF